MQMQFEMWSTFHYFMMIFPFVLAVTLYIFTRDKTFAVKRRVAIAMGIILVGILAIRQIYVFSTDGLGPEVFPFHISHFANILLLMVAINPARRVISTIAWCLAVPAGLQPSYLPMHWKHTVMYLASEDFPIFLGIC
ncbi:hypothetical protein IRB23SM22_22360 [Alkalibacterium sp. s-m-22]